MHSVILAGVRGSERLMDLREHETVTASPDLYGFLNAGGGSWYWKPLRNLEPGHRGFAFVSGAGHVGIGQVTGKVIPARDAQVEIEGQRQPLLDQPDVSAAWKQSAAS